MKTIQRHFTIWFATAAILIFLGSASAEEQGMRTANVKLTHESAKRVADDHHDTCAHMANCGIDYPVLIQRALDGDPNAIRLLLLRHEIFRVDGAVAESYSETRYKVALLIGDEKLTAALRRRPDFDFTLLRRSFLGWPNPEASDPAKAEAEIRKNLPTFWQMITDKVEQDGTGQPATRPESKSEGGDKPQPEAEERSR